MKIVNKKARFNYDLEGRYEAGVALKGAEAKSIREGRADLSRSYGKILTHEAYLVNANIPASGLEGYDPARTRKLLLHRREIAQIEAILKQRRLTLVPMSMYTKGRLVKVGLRLGKPKRKFEKRQTIKSKDIKRDLERELKG